jgi:23S rRNA (cytidine1920-2'-O)/16S rRNA (cytidine1409-2'-O)-methyltransferase
LLPVVKNWLDEAGDVVALVKPQFEATREETDAGKGVIRDSAIHERILREVIRFAAEQGFSPRGLIRSPIQGPKGNIEFLLWLNTGKVKTAPKRMIDEALA